jgi:hypothetical protein
MVQLKSILLTLAAIVLISCSGKPKETAAAPVAPAVPAEQPAPPLAKAESRGLPAGAVINVRTLEVIDSQVTPNGKYIAGIVDDDVAGSDGRLAIPAGTHVVLVVRDVGREGAVSHATLGLFSIEVDGHSHRFNGGVKDGATLRLSEDATQGASRRTVHLEADSHVTFKLDAPLDLR